MEFDLNNIITENTINYNYDNTTFYKNQFEKTLENGGYIKIPYASKSNTPNILSNELFDGQYITKNLYIIKKIHTIKNVIFNGELVIEYTSLTNNEATLYTCFLLKTLSNNSESTKIDKLIQGANDVSIDMNSYITDKNAIFYKTINENVVIFPTPISVVSIFDNYKSPPIMSSQINEYSIVNVTSNLGNIEDKKIEGFKEGATSDYIDVATYCQPIDEEDPTIGTSADVIIPVDGKVSINKATTSQLSTALNFFGFFILVLFVVMVVPTMYQYFIVLLVLDNSYNEIPFRAQELLNRLSAVDIVFGFMLFMFSFSLINNGIVNNKPINTVVGFYVFLFFIASFIVLQYQRLFNEVEFLKKFGDLGGPASITNIKPDIFGLISDNIAQLFVKYERNKITGKKELKIQSNFVVVGVIFGIILAILNYYKLDKSSGTSIFMSIPFYMFFLSIYIAIYIKHSRDAKERGEDISSTTP
jgi:hypothetical protein